MSEATPDARTVEPDAWKWWEARRLTYNVTLAAAGVAAYGIGLAIHSAYGWPTTFSGNALLGMTLNLGIGYLIFMFAANVFYLLGMLTEGWTKPTDRNAFRKHIFALGLWGSVALPFLFPLGIIATRLSFQAGWD